MDPATIAAATAVISLGKTIYDIYDDASSKSQQRDREMQVLAMNRATTEARMLEAQQTASANATEDIRQCYDHSGHGEQGHCVCDSSIHGLGNTQRQAGSH